MTSFRSSVTYFQVRFCIFCLYLDDDNNNIGFVESSPGGFSCKLRYFVVDRRRKSKSLLRFYLFEVDACGAIFGPGMSV